MAQPWGDITTSGDQLNLVVFDWPEDGRVYLSGLQADIVSAGLRSAEGEFLPLQWQWQRDWLVIDGSGLTREQTAGLASVVELKLREAPLVDPTIGVHPNHSSLLLAEFATAHHATKKEVRWMEKFGEWKHVTQVGEWMRDGVAIWEVDVAEAGAYHVELTYRGEGRPVWSIETDEGGALQNQQAATSGYHAYPFGILEFKTPGRHTVAVSLVEGAQEKSSLKSVRLSPVR
jgi:alpha-L-fucosidase